MSKEQQQNTNTNSGPKDFHVHFLPGTADWLRSKTNRDAPTVPAVIRKIVEEAQQRDTRNSKS